MKDSGVEVNYYSIIYEALDDVRSWVSGMLKPEIKEQIVGLAEVREVFRSSKFGTVAGCLVVEGIIKRGNPVRVLRDNVVIHQGELSDTWRCASARRSRIARSAMTVVTASTALSSADAAWRSGVERARSASGSDRHSASALVVTGSPGASDVRQATGANRIAAAPPRRVPRGRTAPGPAVARRVGRGRLPVQPPAPPRARSTGGSSRERPAAPRRHRTDRVRGEGVAPDAHPMPVPDGGQSAPAHEPADVLVRVRVSENRGKELRRGPHAYEFVLAHRSPLGSKPRA